MTPEVKGTHPPQNAEDVDENVFEAVKTEIQHEVHNIEHTKEPVDPTQSDVLVQKHVSGLFIIILSFVAVFLLIAIGAIWLYGRH